jgi:hypothetical protein
MPSQKLNRKKKFSPSSKDGQKLQKFAFQYGRKGMKTHEKITGCIWRAAEIEENKEEKIGDK